MTPKTTKLTLFEAIQAMIRGERVRRASQRTYFYELRRGRLFACYQDASEEVEFYQADRAATDWEVVS